ncbi:XF1762 family protein [Lentzea sp. NPDC051838]|uniref:XF1762 family protein n=1 Tax=Lentzea sp. NPDC051838 TaxID=3154849 RepID=UPI003428EB99
MTVVPIPLRQASAFVTSHHRHHKAPHLDDGWTIEVTRTCTTGTRNANSMLYAAAWRAARSMGYRRMITYTQSGESGASLRAAGFRAVVMLRPRRGWDSPCRPRVSHGVDNVGRTRWEICTSAAQSNGDSIPRAA